METIEGLVLDIIYRGADGYTVAEIEGDAPTTVVGSMPDLKTGERARFFGEFKEHKTYGMQFFASGYESDLPVDVNDIALFLAGGFIKGLGERLSLRIVEAFGEDTFSVIETDPERLSTVKGVSKKMALSIHEGFMEYSGKKESYAKLMGLGLSAKQAVSVSQSMGPSAAAKICENPYLLIQTVRGIDFLTADALAKNLGITDDHPLRLESGIIHILRKSLDRGYTNVPEAMLIGTASSKLQVDKEKCLLALNNLTLAGRLVRKKYDDGYFVFLYSAYQAETEAALKLIALLKAPVRMPVFDLEQKLCAQQREYSFSEEQMSALRTALQNNVCVITGGPGTGKTTILKAIAHVFAASGIDFALCAPTGRAAKRMQETCGTDASTIHRLLEYSHEEGMDNQDCVFKRNAKNPLPVGAVIADEASMIDVFLLRSLLSALKNGTRLILVGDANQLPSVGAGAVMEDILSSGVLPVCTLTHVYRHDGGIAHAAHAILRGELPRFDGDFQFIETENEQEIADRALEEYQAEQAQGSDVQMLAPVKNTPLGTRALDTRLRDCVNPPKPGKQEFAFGEHVFRVHDRVMQIKNNYARAWRTEEMRGEGIFNGDIGEIVRIAAGTVTVSFEGRLSDYEPQELSELAGAYAYTIHKSQGNEFDVVILPMKYPEILFFSRNLLYTEVTRAKKRAVLIGSKRTLKFMIDNNKRDKRYTALKKELLLNARIFL